MIQSDRKINIFQNNIDQATKKSPYNYTSYMNDMSKIIKNIHKNKKKPKKKTKNQKKKDNDGFTNPKIQDKELVSKEDSKILRTEIKKLKIELNQSKIIIKTLQINIDQLNTQKEKFQKILFEQNKQISELKRYNHDIISKYTESIRKLKAENQMLTWKTHTQQTGLQLNLEKSNNLDLETKSVNSQDSNNQNYSFLVENLNKANQLTSFMKNVKQEAFRTNNATQNTSIVFEKVKESYFWTLLFRHIITSKE